MSLKKQSKTMLFLHIGILLHRKDLEIPCNLVFEKFKLKKGIMRPISFIASIVDIYEANRTDRISHRLKQFNNWKDNILGHAKLHSSMFGLYQKTQFVKSQYSALF